MKINELMPLFAAILGLTPVFLKWLNDRSNEAANRRAIQKAKEQIEFWQVWLKAQREVTTDERFNELKNKVSKRLDQLVETSDELTASKSDKTEEEFRHSFLQRLFLAYVPHTTVGWVLHTLFYVSFSFTAMLVFGSAISENDPEANLSWSQFVSELDFVIPMLLFFALIAFFLVRTANRAEKRYQTAIKEADIEANSCKQGKSGLSNVL